VAVPEEGATAVRGQIGCRLRGFGQVGVQGRRDGSPKLDEIVVVGGGGDKTKAEGGEGGRVVISGWGEAVVVLL